MSKYYYLIAGLPNIAFDDSKLPYTVTDFKNELANYLSEADSHLLDIFSLKTDNQNLLKYIQYPDYDLDTEGKVTYDQFNALFESLAEEEEGNPVKVKIKHLPPYFEPFVKAYRETAAKEEKTVVSWEDRLSALYYAYAMTCKNSFVAAWFELNLTLTNILTAITCRKYQLDRANYIVGSGEVSDKLRTSNARDFDLGDAFNYLPDVLRLAEETDLLQREKKVDALKWEWLSDNTFSGVFDIESVLAYLLKLELLERWTTLNKTTGEKAFRQLVGTMKKGSDSALEEFKRNNKK
jgi:hypothetical protein